MFEAGTKVLVNGRPGIITGKTYNTFWEVDFITEKGFFAAYEIEVIKEKPQLADAFQNQEFGGISDFRQCLYPHRLSSSLSNFMYSMGNTATQFLPHQFVPVIKFLESYTNNLLIADEVGLGKTIEAMYIWEEVRAREKGNRLLIVCPARLRVKWQVDVKRYFNIEANITTPTELKKKIEEAIHCPWGTSFALIISLEGLRTSEGVKEILNDDLKNKVFDLVIVDEAHYMRNSQTQSYKMGEKLRDSTNHLLLLSATPIQTGSDNFFNLLSLLSPYEFYDRDLFDCWLRENKPLVRLANALEANAPIESVREILGEVLNSSSYGHDSLFQQIQKDLNKIYSKLEKKIQVLGQIKSRYFYNSLLSRNRKCDVFENRPQRVPNTVRFKLSHYEREFYEQVSDYLRSQQSATGETFSTFRLIARQRQMASSIPAALLSWREGNATGVQKNKKNDEEEDLDSIFDLEDETVNVKRATFSSMPRFNEFDLEKLIEEDSKFDAIYKQINKILKDNPKEKIILFSFFRKTIEYLYKRFAEKKIACISVMGGVSPDETDGIIADFKKGNANILLTTEVCSEGVDLQFARYEINYDLPWNPMRLEQRIGRIDRIGQESPKIFICNAICDNTIEDRVLEKLYERIMVFTETLGNIEEVLGREINALQLDLFQYKSLTQEEIEQFAEQRVTAIANKAQMQEQLEEQAGLIASDYQKFILENVKKSYSNLRHVSPEELVFVVQDVLEAKYHGSSIEFAPSKFDEVKITLSFDAKYEFNNFQKIHCPAKRSVLLTATSAVPCVIRQRLSNENREVIDINHPLIRWVLHEVDAEKHKLSRCEALEISRDLVSDFPKIEPGTYVYYIRRWESKGVQTKSELWYYMMDLKTKTVVPHDMAERVLVLTMLYGDSYNLNYLDDEMYEDSGEALERLCENIVDYCERRKNEHEEENRALGEVQRHYIARSFEQKKTRIEKIIQTHELNRNKGLARAEQKRLSEEKVMYEERLKELNKKFDAKASFKEVALGILVIH